MNIFYKKYIFYILLLNLKLLFYNIQYALAKQPAVTK